MSAAYLLRQSEETFPHVQNFAYSITDVQAKTGGGDLSGNKRVPTDLGQECAADSQLLTVHLLDVSAPETHLHRRKNRHVEHGREHAG